MSISWASGTLEVDRVSTNSDLRPSRGVDLVGHRKLLSTVTGLDRYVCGRQNPNPAVPRPKGTWDEKLNKEQTWTEGPTHRKCTMSW